MEDSLEAVALAQAAISRRGATCKWLLDNGANRRTYLCGNDRSGVPQALVAYVYCQDGNLDLNSPR